MGVNWTSADTPEKLDAIGHQVEMFLFTLRVRRRPANLEKSRLSLRTKWGYDALTYEKN